MGSVVEGVEEDGDGEEVRARFRGGCWCKSSLSSSWVHEDGAGDEMREKGSMYVVGVAELDIIGDDS